MNIGGLGDTGSNGQDCGTNPCTFLDSIYAGWGSDQCVPYLQCMNPYDARVIGALGAGAHGVAVDVGSAVAGGANALGQGLDFSGIALAAAAIGIVLFLKK